MQIVSTPKCKLLYLFVGLPPPLLPHSHGILTRIPAAHHHLRPTPPPSVTHPERHIMVTRYTEGIAMILMTNRPLFPRPASWFLCCANNMRVALCKRRRFVCSALAAQNHHVKGKYDTIGRCHRANGLLFVKMYFRPLKAFLHTQNKEEQRGGA